MERNSSTSSSSRGLRGKLLGIAMALSALWVLWLAGGRALGMRLGSAFASELTHFSKGRILNPPEFVANRLFETLYLATILGLLVALALVIEAAVKARVRRVWAWVPLSVYLFVACNAFVAAAAETGLYWGVLMLGGPNLKQSAFHSERIRLRESSAAKRVVVVGSSQGNAQISAGQLNRQFHPEVEFANLSYAGAQAFDLLLIQDFYSEIRPDVVVCYLSKLNLYTPCGGGRFLPLMNPRGWSDFAELAPPEASLAEERFYGAQGILLPVFRSRRALELGLFGAEAGEARAARPGRAGEAGDDPLRSAAAETARQYRVGPEAEFQKRALARFLERNTTANTVTVLIKGQMHPLLESLISPDVHRDFENWLGEISSSGRKVVVLDDDLPRSESEAYSDLAHVTEAERVAFTAALGRQLNELFHWADRIESATPEVSSDAD